ncbi:rRNA pseudouridine synthase [Patescibacteria group bacterium]|nr:rRNA pseudouridine synthase [Patescibacteria group bacterium]
MRINKFLSLAGVCSRRAADVLISQKKILVNHHPATLGEQIDPGKDLVTYRGEKLTLDHQKLYYLLNKPPHVVSTAKDDRGRPTVTDYLKIKKRLYPVGRLDFDSTGLILLTNDGDLALCLTHPRYHLPKTYLVTIDRPLTVSELTALRRGVVLEDGPTLPATITPQNSPPTRLEITLNQGKNRQIRRMMAHFDHRVLTLHRTAIGPLKIGSLSAGQARPLTPAEIMLLKSI